jgi:uncharacterized membrane protein
MKLKITIKYLLHSLWSLFLNGLFTLLPLTITVAIFIFSFRIIAAWLEPINALAPRWFPYSEIVLVILFILLTGFILRSLILRSIIHSAEKLFSKLPLIRPIYTGIKQLVHAFSPQEPGTSSFKKIVILEFPLKEIYSIGFLTGEVALEINPAVGKRFFNVFIPTTPNPTSGFFVMVPEDKISVIDLTQQEAMALIISGGIIQPERFAKIP